jgi:hypothetical protein
MIRKYTRSGPIADIGLASAYNNQYYRATDTGIYYFSNGSVWKTETFDEGNSVNSLFDAAAHQAVKLVMPANLGRRWLLFQNISDAHMHIGLGFQPETVHGDTSGILVEKNGGVFRMDNFVVTDAIYVYCSANDKRYIALEG